MRFFVTAAEREAGGSTGFLEFQRGAFRGKYWLPDSICLPAELFSQSGLSALLRETLPGFTPYNVTRVTKKQWNALLAASAGADAQTQAMLAELSPWADACFSRCRVFHIIGL